MAEVMSYERWMKSTYGGVTARRSPKLQAIDNALKSFHGSPRPANLDALKRALTLWMQSKGQSWKTSVRNRHHAIEHLFLQVNELPRASRKEVPPIRLRTPEGLVTWTGEDAERYVEAQRSALVDTFFRDKRMDWRPGFLKKLGDQKIGTTGSSATLAKDTRDLVLSPTMAQQAATNRSTAEAFGRQLAGSSTARAIKLASEILDEMVPGPISKEVTLALDQVMPAFLGQLAASITPLLGVITSGGATVWGAYKTSIGVYRLSEARQHAVEAIPRSGGPGEAVKAMIRVLERELSEEAASLSINTTALGAKVGALFAGDPLVVNAAAGIAAATAKLTNIIRIIVRDVQEKNAANGLIRSGAIDLAVFDTCPVLGGYFVALAPKSALLNLLASQWGILGWMDDVESLITRHILPLQEQAVRVVRTHRFHIPGLERHAGLVQPNEAAIQAAMARKGKTGMVGFGPQQPTLQRQQAQRHLG